MRYASTLIRLAPSLLLACGGDGGGGTTGPSRPGADGGDRGDVAGVGDAGDASGDTPADAPTPDAEPRPDVAGECTPGVRECADAANVRVCGGDASWRVEACQSFEACVDGACTPDASLCRGGDRICLDPSTPALCVPGTEWQAQPPCDAGERCVEGECVSSACALAAERGSYLGCEYLAIDLPNLAYSPTGTPTAPVGIVVANSTREPAAVFIDAPDGSPAPLVASVTVSPPALFSTEAPVPIQSQITGPDGAVVDSAFADAQGRVIPADGMGVFLARHGGLLTTTQVRAQGWTVRTTQPVAAWQFSPYCCNFSYTNDASLLLPVSTLGTEYVAIGVPSWGVLEESTDDRFPDPTLIGFPAVLTVVASRSSTSVTVELGPRAAVAPGADSRIIVSGNTVATTLRLGEALHLFAPDATSSGFSRPPLGPDWTGSRITSNHPVAVFTSHVCSYYPQTQEACDHLEEQLFPVDTWGRDYVLAPILLRTTNPGLATEATFFKIVAARDATRIELTAPYASLDPRPSGFEGVPTCADYLDGDSTLVLDAGEHCEFGTRVPVAVRASAPVQVMGTISGESSTAEFSGRRGDPSIFLLPPERQFRNEYTFIAPTTYHTDWVTLVVAAGSTILLDGEEVDLSRGEPVPGTSWQVVHVRSSDGPHRISGTAAFGMVAYAFDNWVSYAFTGGLDLSKDAEAGR